MRERGCHEILVRGHALRLDRRSDRVNGDDVIESAQVQPLPWRARWITKEIRRVLAQSQPTAPVGPDDFAKVGEQSLSTFRMTAVGRERGGRMPVAGAEWSHWRDTAECG